jgi:hypothetical protein
MATTSDGGGMDAFFLPPLARVGAFSMAFKPLRFRINF